MNTSTVSTLTTSLPSNMPTVARKGFQLLQRIQGGNLVIDLPDGGRMRLGDDSCPVTTMRLNNWNVFAAVLQSGDVGLAESYMAGDWTTPDLTKLMSLMLTNRHALERLVYGSWWGRLAYRLRHLLNRNTKANSRRNIHAHYDLGNDFYQLWLDSSMNYSSASFEGNPDGDLMQAQHAKMRRALRSAGVQPGSRVLEIGCGWGAVAEMAAGEFQAHVTGVTLSTEQLDYAKVRLEAAGLSERADLRLQDYRDIHDGPYDAICSIEMVEAVGQEYWPAYFETLKRLLKPGGRACVQSIVIDDALFDRYVQGTDFIQQYVFPGGCLPSPSRFHEEAARAGLHVEQTFSFGRDYAETLRRWHQQFKHHRASVLNQGFDHRFLRLWEFYLAYCEAAFDSQNVDVVQYTLVKPST